MARFSGADYNERCGESNGAANGGNRKPKIFCLFASPIDSARYLTYSRLHRMRLAAIGIVVEIKEYLIRKGQVPTIRARFNNYESAGTLPSAFEFAISGNDEGPPELRKSNRPRVS
jgi:hypothetical protein